MSKPVVCFDSLSLALSLSRRALPGSEGALSRARERERVAGLKVREKRWQASEKQRRPLVEQRERRVAATDRRRDVVAGFFLSVRWSSVLPPTSPLRVQEAPQLRPPSARASSRNKEQAERGVAGDEKRERERSHGKKEKRRKSDEKKLEISSFSRSRPAAGAGRIERPLQAIAKRHTYFSSVGSACKLGALETERGGRRVLSFFFFRRSKVREGRRKKKLFLFSSPPAAPLFFAFTSPLPFEKACCPSSAPLLIPFAARTWKLPRSRRRRRFTITREMIKQKTKRSRRNKNFPLSSPPFLSLQNPARHLHQLPQRQLHVPALRVGPPDGQPNDTPTSELRRVQQHSTPGVDLFDQRGLRPFPLSPFGKPETDQAESRRRRELKQLAPRDLLGEPRGELAVVADKRAQTGEAVGPQDKPELEGTEPASQRHLPVPEVAVVVAGDEVGGREGERRAEPAGVLDPEGGAVEVGEAPEVV